MGARWRLGLFAAAASASLAPAASAQNASEQVIVTATHRPTPLQDVPIAVTPVTAELVRNSGIRDFHDLINVTASLQFNVSENETSATARLRGVGTQGSNPGLESAVGIFVDGVYRARNGVALTDLGEISQIEVLRGPQGTLFGRNTSAGLISVTTAAPDLDHVTATGEASLGAFNEQRFSASLTGPLERDQLGFRLYAATNRRDGFNDVINRAGARSEANDRDLRTVRGQVLWQPSPKLNMRLIADHSERSEQCCTAVFYDPRVVNGVSDGYTATAPARALASIGGFGPAGLAALGNAGFSDRTTFANRATTQDLSDNGVSLETNWHSGLGTFTAISAYRDWNFEQGQDIDFTAADLLYRLPGDGGFSFQIYTQEARLAGRAGALDWLIGGYYSNELLRRRDTLRIGTDYGAYFAALGSITGSATISGAAPVLGSTVGGGQRDHYRQTGDSVALFTHNILALDAKTDLTFGARFTSEDKDFEGVRQTIGALPAPLNAFPWHNASLDGIRRQTRSESEWSGVLALRREFAEGVSGYLSYSRGYKGGGFNLDREFDGDNSFAAETVNSYEAGAKTDWFGGDLVLNGALFVEQFDNYQLNRFTGITFVVNSVPQVTSRGAELDMVWRAPITGLSMQGGLAYDNAEYGDAGAWSVGGLAGLPNAQLTNAPLWTVTDSITYEWPLFRNALNGLAYLDFRYVTDQNTASDLNAAKEQPAYVVFNGRLGFSTPDERYSLEIWGRNLLNQDFAQIMFDPPLQFLAPTLPITGLHGAFLGDPRTYGVTLRARY